jgi:hypothetical protein
MAMIWEGKTSNGVRCRVFDDCMVREGTAEARRMVETASLAAHAILRSVAAAGRTEDARHGTDDICRNERRRADLVDEAHGDARGAVRGAIDDWRTRMKRAETPEAYCTAAQRIDRLYEYLDRCEMDIAELYILMEKKGLTT